MKNVKVCNKIFERGRITGVILDRFWRSFF